MCNCYMVGGHVMSYVREFQKKAKAHRIILSPNKKKGSSNFNREKKRENKKAEGYESEMDIRMRTVLLHFSFA